MNIKVNTKVLKLAMLGAMFIPTLVMAQPKPSTMHKVGEQFSVGYWTYRCEGIDWQKWIDGEAADAAFLVVNISVRNDDRTASTLPPMKLVDSEGREYEESAKGTFGAWKKLNPGVTSRGIVVFDVPFRRDYTLQVSGGLTSGVKTLVDLHQPEPVQPTAEQIAAANKAAAERAAAEQKAAEQYKADLQECSKKLIRESADWRRMPGGNDLDGIVNHLHQSNQNCRVKVPEAELAVIAVTGASIPVNATAEERAAAQTAAGKAVCTSLFTRYVAEARRNHLKAYSIERTLNDWNERRCKFSPLSPLSQSEIKSIIASVQ